MTSAQESDFEIRIRPNQNWLRIDLRAIWEFRDLLALLVRRDFVARYQQTALGPAWAIVQPLAMTFVFTLVFGKFAGISTDGLPPILFYLCGLLAWNYHAQTFQLTAGTFTVNADLFGKVYFPRLIVPLSIALSNLIALAIEAAIFGLFWTYYKLVSHAAGGFGTDARALLAPLLLIHIAAVSIGSGLIVASCTAKYRDLRHVLPLIVQVWLYLTPVIYPLSKVPSRWQWVMALNPVAPPVEAMRYLLLGRGEVHPGQYCWAAGIGVFLFVAGIMIFQRTERTFIDTI
jgi:homopolymeric O-antigen transport system permease protein